jgi:outer membrane protein with beta-barrel domain
MFSSQRWQCVVGGLLMTAATASAQGTPPPQSGTVPQGNMWSHGTTLNVFSGGALGGDDRASTRGAGLGWEITPWFALEGSGTWIEWEKDANAFTPAITAQVALPTPGRVVPFATGGVGLYRVSFDRIDVEMPHFYRERMATMNAMGSAVTFTDPSVVGGGGVNVFVTRKWTIRPEVLATMVMRDAHTFVVTTAALRLGYHFEAHPVAP